MLPLALAVTAFVPPQAQSQQRCDVAIVGGGPGGIYFAWRLLKSGSDKSVCIYERSDRFGGRIYSLRKQGPKEDLVVDMGAYRYAPEPYVEPNSTWYVYTPLLGGLIDTELKLPSVSYEPGDPTSTVRKIVDAEGQNAGYLTFVEALQDQLSAFEGYSMSFNQECVSIATGADGRVVLSFASGLSVSAAQVVLNVPQLPLLNILDRSESILGASGGMPAALQVPSPVDGVKLYVHYANAWWRNLLNLSSGEFGPNMHNATTIPLTQLPTLSGRYHDGHTRCDGPADAECRGYLEATYTYATGARFFLNHEPSAEPPYTELTWGQPSGRFALQMVHRVLIDYHKEALQDASKRLGLNATALVEGLRPDSALLSYWGPQTPGYGGAVHNTRPGPLLEEKDLAPLAMAPFGELPIYVANEAFGALRGADGVLGGHHGWAECSLVMAENILATKFGVAPPTFVNESTYDEYVRFQHAPEERARRGGWHQG